MPETKKETEMHNSASNLERNTEIAINYLKYIAAGSGSEGQPAFDKAFSLVSEDFEIDVMPASLKMPKMKLKPYRAWLEPMVKNNFVSFEARVVNTTAQDNRVVIEATSSAKTIDGRDYGQQYFIAFEFDDAGKIRLIKEYTDSLYSSRFYTKVDRPKT
jgi:ketosteroid isomerase-like protein